MKRTENWGATKSLNHRISQPNLGATKSHNNKKTEKGMASIAIKCLNGNEGYILNILELSSKTKVKNYYKTSVNVANRFIENMGETAKIIYEKDFEYNNQKGREISFVKGNFTYFYRSILIEGYLYQMTYFTSKPKEEDHSYYFKSFITK